MTFYRPSTVSVLLALFAASSLVADDTEMARRSLRGLDNVSVVIEDLTAGAREIGLSVDSLRTSVELKLRQNGIKVTDDARAYIYVNVSVVGDASTYSAEVRQSVRLARDPSISVVASTWSAGGTAAHPNGPFIRDCVGELIDKFLNAWLSVNPARPR